MHLSGNQWLNKVEFPEICKKMQETAKWKAEYMNQLRCHNCTINSRILRGWINSRIFARLN